MSGHSLPSKVTRKLRPPSKRTAGALAGPRRNVVYIFEREGARGAAYWLLVLECGHSATRPRVTPSTLTLLRPLSEKLAPKHAQCIYCEAGCDKSDPWILIKAYGGI